jgi:hypothetical protein
MASSCRVNGCGEHGEWCASRERLANSGFAGQCAANGVCSCDRFWLGTTCDQSFIESVGEAPWYALVSIACAIHVICMLVGLWRFVDLWRSTKQCASSSVARDVASWLDFGGSFMRVLWFAGVASGSNEDVRAADGLLLRIPQAAWLSAYLCVVLVWSDIIASAGGGKAPWWQKWAIVASTLVLAVTTGTLTVEDALEGAGFGGHSTYRDAGDWTFAVFVMVLSVLGFMAASRLKRVSVSVAESLAHITAPEERFRIRLTLQKLRVAYNMTIVSLSTAGILVTCVAIVSACGVGPETNPSAFLGYMYVVHCVVEPAAAIVLLVITKRDRIPPRRDVMDTTRTMSSSRWRRHGASSSRTNLSELSRPDSLGHFAQSATEHTALLLPERGD